MQEVKTTIEEDGRITLPNEYCQILGLRTGDEVILRLEAGGVRILNPHAAIQQAQALVRQYIPEGRSLSQELIDQRREESQRE
jgi:bifunctional DNA-binding transcriptional regulator/antitoxin component of YhaV-PrlF toxin-antitoxin module